MLHLTISVFNFNRSVIGKVYSCIETFRRSVPLLPLIISVFLFNCLVITKVYRGIQTFRRSVSLLPLIVLVFILTAQLSQRFTVASRRFVGVCHCCL